MSTSLLSEPVLPTSAYVTYPPTRGIQLSAMLHMGEPNDRPNHMLLPAVKGLSVTWLMMLARCRLGHANPAITMSVYSHALKHQDEEAARVT